MNQPTPFQTGGVLGFEGAPSVDRPIGLVGLGLGLDLRPSAMMFR